MNEEIEFFLRPMKVAYGDNFVKECESKNKSCVERTMLNYDSMMNYIDQKFFRNANIYPSGKDCKTIVGDNDLSYYWCVNAKKVLNYNFEIIFLIINTFLCITIFLIRLIR